MTSLDECARGFVVRMQGRWTPADAEGLRKRYGRRETTVDEATMAGALHAARGWFMDGASHLFVCGGEPCRERSRDFDGLLERVAPGVMPADLRTSVTTCQGPCKQAPVGTLRVGDRCAMFAEVHDVCDWDGVLDYANRAARERTLLVDPGTAQAFLFDPVHPRDHTAAALKPLAFLIGHVTGDGGYLEREGSFHKEVVGTWEAGGRFLGLRMAVTYPLDDGRNDVHQALVLIGYDAKASTYAARAYTDSGTTRDYELALDGERVVFADRVPGHGVVASRARKVLTPHPAGYDETLEVQPEGELFHAYSTVALRTAARPS